MNAPSSRAPFELAMAFTLKAEGKFTIDDGGPTMCGVTQHVYDAYRMRNNLPIRSVKLIEHDEVEDIMHSEYWVPAHCDAMGVKLAIAMFDWAYNHGAEGAIVTLQQCLGVLDDGIFGAITSKALDAADGSLVPRFLDARRAWCRNAAAKNPRKYQEYLSDWLKRIDQLEAYLSEVS